ncbi:MAG: carboxypeptidase-like regulatory domain-containing protein [Bacteroidia bacterium]
MPEPILRDYSITDPDMIQDARTKHASFTEDKTDFVAFDPDFADPYADDFEDEIDAAEAMPDDETILDQQAQLTAAVEEEMQKSRDKYQDSKPFITKAFPNDAAIQNEFGFNDYRQAQKGQSTFIKFMLKFHSVADKYKTQLIAANYTQPKIDEILTRYTALKDADIAQELFIKNRPVKTQERIEKYNTAWKTETVICTAGKRIYKNNYAKYQRYLLPPGEEAPEALSIRGTVTNAATNAPEEDVNVEITANGILVTTNAQGIYGIGGLPAGTYTVKFSKAGLQDVIRNNVVVVDGEVTTVDVQMQSV